MPSELISEMDWTIFDSLFYEVRQNAQKQLMASGLDTNLIFYAWLDPQAGQLRYNIISSKHEKLPFASELVFAQSSWLLCDAFVKGLQKGEWTEIDKTFVFQCPIAKPSVFDFFPNKALNSIEFNITIEETRKRFGLIHDAHMRDAEKGTSKDYFNESSVIFSYDKDGKFEAAELYLPSELSINGIKIMGSPLIKTIRKLEKLAPFAITQEQDHDFRTLGILIPKSNKIKYVLVYREGYWEAYEKEYGKL